MLKLFGNLRNRSSRLGSRTSWSTSNRQMVCPCSSVATASQIKISKETEPQSIKPVKIQEKSKYHKVNLAFNNLLCKSTPEKTKKDLISEILQVTNNKTIDVNYVKKILKTLHQMVNNKEIKLEDFKDDPKYVQLCSIVSNSTNSIKSSQLKNFQELPDLTGKVSEESVYESMRVLSSLVAKQYRNKPLLTNIATNIHQSKTILSVKNIADILYGMACLSFPENLLLDKLCGNLRNVLKIITQSPIIGSIVTSLGMLRYRDEVLLDMISEWMVNHKDILRTRDLCALIMTLATLGYQPKTSDILFKELVPPLKETDMIRSSEWLDFVWALTVLNQVTAEQIDSVLNSQFLNKNIDPSENIPQIRANKFLNINATAQLLLPNYSGSLLSAESQVFNSVVVNTKDKQIFVKAITDALANLFPSRDHFCANVNIGTGFPLDVEFCIDKQGAPLPLDTIKDTTNVKRIAIVANHYRDYCVGGSHLLGPVFLHYRLLQAKGYEICVISHTEFHGDDKLLKRITYLNDRIKSIVK